MSDDFFKTKMGHRFYEATMPKITDQLERLNANLEALIVALRAFQDRIAPADGDRPDSVDERGAPPR